MHENPSYVSYDGEVSTTTSQGPLKGINLRLNDGLKFSWFTAVPYAHIPEGELRFAPPLRIEKWSDRNVLERVRNTRGRSLKDNVLYLDIYTPQIKTREDEEFDRPVIVFVPGDVLRARHSRIDQYGPQYLMREDVVLVTVSYRVGILGFVKANNPEARAPGSVGLMDLRTVFLWVKEEIENFGGCSKNVTAYGKGLGATHVRKLLVDGHFDRWFDKAILSSCIEHKIHLTELFEDGNYNGPLLAHFISQQETKTDKTTHLTGSVDDEVACMKYLRSLDERWLQYFHAMLTSSNTKEGLSPVEVKILLEEKYPAPIPVIIGYNSLETLHYFRILNVWIYSEFLLKHGAVELRKERVMEGHVARRVSNLICAQSFENVDPYMSETLTLDERMKSSTMHSVVVGLIAVAKNLARQMERVFLYRFSINTAKGKQQGLNSLNSGRELNFLFGHTNFFSFDEDVDNNLIKMMTNFWAQFARTGDPNPTEPNQLVLDKWKPMGVQLSDCLNIEETGAKVEEIPEMDSLLRYEKLLHAGLVNGSTLNTANK